MKGNEMAEYQVLQPVSVVRDGKVHRYTSRDIGTVVMVDDEQAEQLVDTGQLAVVAGLSNESDDIPDLSDIALQQLDDDDA